MISCPTLSRGYERELLVQQPGRKDSSHIDNSACDCLSKTSQSQYNLSLFITNCTSIYLKWGSANVSEARSPWRLNFVRWRLTFVDSQHGTSKEINWLIGKKSHLPIENKLLIHKAVIKQIWSYGIELWSCASKSNIVIMRRSQSIILRALVNIPWHVTNHTLHTDFNIP